MPSGTFPTIGTTGNASSRGAPARYSGTGGPGTLVTSRVIRRWRADSQVTARRAAVNQLPQAAGDRGQHHVVDLGVVAVRDLPGQVQAAAHNGQPAVAADRAVQAGPRRTLFGEDLTP